jgi:hypothetical protein
LSSRCHPIRNPWLRVIYDGALKHQRVKNPRNIVIENDIVQEGSRVGWREGSGRRCWSNAKNTFNHDNVWAIEVRPR